MQEFICECMDKMEALFQEQRRRLPQSMHITSATATIVSQHLQQQQQSCVNFKCSSTTPTDVIEL
ncbi:AAEL010709-PA [Aedes aegypti]|uniref:AAEL010709-PA n=1 Tax=Aedes aegypti TaxID=7159 RepID=Q16S44_AEDAE|nr:AAEL010709-PA [Aedes aegypti]